MPDLTAKRTLVKSPPELWEELSEVEGLAKHFGAFGEIKITKLEPEHTVAWEGEHASGTVSIEPSGWGTKVTLHAELPEVEEEPVAEEPSQSRSRRSLNRSRRSPSPSPRSPWRRKRSRLSRRPSRWRKPKSRRSRSGADSSRGSSRPGPANLSSSPSRSSPHPN